MFTGMSWIVTAANVVVMLIMCTAASLIVIIGIAVVIHLIKDLFWRRLEMANKKKKEVIGLISGRALVRQTRPEQNIPFRTGGHLTKKDRPRDKSYKKYRGDDDE